MNSGISRLQPWRGLNGTWWNPYGGPHPDAILIKTDQKGNEKWEVSRDAATKVTGDLKVGSKVTIEYKMTATKIDVKEEKKADAKKKK